MVAPLFCITVGRPKPYPVELGRRESPSLLRLVALSPVAYPVICIAKLLRPVLIREIGVSFVSVFFLLSSFPTSVFLLRFCLRSHSAFCSSSFCLPSLLLSSHDKNNPTVNRVPNTTSRPAVPAKTPLSAAPSLRRRSRHNFAASGNVRSGSRT